jgi:hypothetical protein
LCGVETWTQCRECAATSKASPLSGRIVAAPDAE